MNKILVTVFILLSSLAFSQQADMKTYEGGWLGELESSNIFTLYIKIEKKKKEYVFKLGNKNASVKLNFSPQNDGTFKIQIDSNLSFKGYLDKKNKKKTRGFIQSGIMQQHVTLAETNKNIFEGKWNLFLTDELNREFFLSIENGNGDVFEAYAVPGDNRLPRLMNYGAHRSNDTIFFKDFRAGLEFAGKLTKQKIFLDIKLFGKVITKLEAKRFEEKWIPSNNYSATTFDNENPKDLNDGWKISNIESEGFDGQLLKALIDSINSNNITNTHGVLIARNGKLIFEKYFEGFNENIPHDMRSASKSISSALTGLTISNGYLKNVNQKLYDLLPEKYKTIGKDDERKSRITLKNLLTMSSGFDAIDFGTDRNSPAAEDNYQNTQDWIKTILESPMINEPGTHSFYGSANPYLLGTAVQEQIKETPEIFFDKKLFAPLGIDNYLWQNDIGGKPYFGGGMFITPRDMLKFGQLYLDEGKWNAKVIIPEEWIEESFKKYPVLENTAQKNEYGYLWWHNNYNVNGEIIESIEARGAGGQYIFIVPEYALTAVVTSANFRNGRFWQPEKIMENYILPAVKK